MSYFIALHDAVACITDPRVDRTKKHQLSDMVVIAVYALLCGAEGWCDIETIATERFEELAEFLDLKNGIPSHDTFQRVFSRLAPSELNAALIVWGASLQESLAGKVVAIDGKTLRRSFDTAAHRSALHSITAYVSENATILGQCFGTSKDSEITQIPELLKKIDVKNAIITIDAIGCQKSIAEQIVTKNKADFVLNLKDNQPSLKQEVEQLFQEVDKNKSTQSCTTFQQHDKGHGRIENRSCLAVDVSGLGLPALKEWKGVKTVARITATRESNSRAQETSTRYFISSLSNDANVLFSAVRQHWAIENSLHWVLDVVFREDDCRIRKDHAPANFASLRRIAYNFVKLNKPNKKQSNRQARLRAMLGHSFARTLLTGI